MPLPNVPSLPTPLVGLAMFFILPLCGAAPCPVQTGNPDCGDRRSDHTVVDDQGKIEQVRIGEEEYVVRWHAVETFSDSTWRERWTVETGAGEAPGRVWVEDGRLHVDDPPESEGVTLWYADPLPADFMLRFRIHRYEERPAGTFVVFAAAREPDGAPLRIGARDGDYETYQARSGLGIRAVLASLTNDHARLRRLPEFNPPLASNEAVGTTPGGTYEVVLAVRDGRVRYYLDGTEVYDHTLGDSLSGGHVALRNWHTRAWWDDVAFGEIVSPGRAE